VDRDREHAVQVVEQRGTALLPQVDDHLSVGGGREAVSALLQVAPQLGEVVDLAVEDDAYAPVLVPERLAPAGGVDDGQAPHAERHAVPHVDPLVVRPAVDQGRAHVADALDAG
jgi:hypothetical protein